MVHPRTIASRLVRGAEHTIREREGRRLLESERLDLRVPEETAYIRLDGAALPRFEELRGLATSLRDERLANPKPLTREKEYFIPLLTEESFRRHPELVELALARRLLALVTGYVGSLPLLRIMQVYWTPSGEYDPKGSQLYHSDKHNLAGRQLKLFVNLVEVAPEDGPFTFLPANVSERVVAAAGEDVRYTDEQVYAVASPEDEISLTGPAGTAMLVDTNRCLHFGARSQGRGRLMLVVQYVGIDNWWPWSIDFAAVGPRPADPFADHTLRRRLRPPR